jgi:hypothetical protein
MNADDVKGLDTSDPATVEVLNEAVVNPEALSEDAKREVEAAAESLAVADKIAAHIDAISGRLDALEGAPLPDDDPRADLAFGTEWRSVRALANAAGLDFDAYKERYAVQVEAGTAKEVELIAALVAMFPPNAAPVLPSALGVLHQLEGARMAVLTGANNGLFDQDALHLISHVLTEVNAHVTGFVSATVTMVSKELAGIPEEQYKSVVVPAFNAVMANKRAIFEQIDANSTEFGNAVREGMKSRGVLPDAKADGEVHGTPPTAH